MVDQVSPNRTLGAQGYSSGDIEPKVGFGVGADRQITTSSNAYGNAAGYLQLQLFITWDELFPSNAETYVFTGVQLSSGGGANSSYQIYNNSDGEVAGGEISDKTGNEDTGWTQYRPTTTSSTIELFPRLKSSTDGTQVKANAPTLLLGAKI